MLSGVYQQELNREAQRLRTIIANAEVLKVLLRSRSQFDPSIPLMSVESRTSTVKAAGSIYSGGSAD